MLTVTFHGPITSPIAPFFQWVPHTLLNVAPELGDEMNSILDGYTLELFEEPAWICSATPETKTFRLSTRVVEILWAQAYAAFVFYNRVMARTPGEEAVVDIVDPDVVAALKVYQWALSRFLDGAADPWPPGLPKPAAGDAVDDDFAAARELALMATGYLLQHEIAHIVLKHSARDPGDASIDQEREADAWAADWLLVRGDPARPNLQKRALGVAVALLVLVSGGIHSGSFNGVTHPRDFDRLYNALAHRIPKDFDAVWGMVTGILYLHLTNKDLLPAHLGPFNTAWDAADALITHLASLEG